MADFEAVIGEAVEAAVARAIAPLLERLEAPAPALLDRRGLAAALGVSLSSVARLLREGLPRIMVGDSPRFELGAVLDWLRGRSEAAPVEATISAGAYQGIARRAAERGA